MIRNVSTAFLLALWVVQFVVPTVAQAKTGSGDRQEPLPVTLKLREGSVLFGKQVKAGDAGRLRCNKYDPPFFIVFKRNASQ